MGRQGCSTSALQRLQPVHLLSACRAASGVASSAASSASKRSPSCEQIPQPSLALTLTGLFHRSMTSSLVSIQLRCYATLTKMHSSSTGMADSTHYMLRVGRIFVQLCAH